uniref:Uncharacterized protein n=1 Tax=Anopheles culicifacies TaxID=139723 RepID=A0A182M541_9DIPT
MYPAKFRPNCFKCFPLHRAAANGSLDKCEQLILSDGMNPYQPTQDGWTALHVAIANKAENVVDLLLDRYEQDLAIVRQTIKHQFLWKTEQVGWKNRPILIGWTEEECEAVLSAMSSCPAGIPLNLQIFVLLRNPLHGHRFIALDVCNRNKWCDIMWLINRLLPNGVLSLDRCDMRRDVENYLQLACALSTKEITVKLIRHGASLNVASGMQGRTPLMAAGEKMRKDIIDLLTTKYADRFDPCACDRANYTVLHRMMHRQHTGMVEYLLNFLLNYRTRKLHESKSVALSKLFTYDSKEYTSLNIWHSVRSVPMKKLCEKYIRECKMDVLTPLYDTTTLGVLIGCGIAVQYCHEQIEQDLTLLELQDNYGKLNILHHLIRNFYDVLRNLQAHFTKTLNKLELNGKRLDDYLDSNRRTFLHAAVSWSDKSLVEKLLARNMDVMKLDDNGCLPIHLVYRTESLFVMLLDKNKPAQLAYVNEAGHNLLHISCRNGLYGEALEVLVEHGMDVNERTPDGEIPLSLASCCATVTFLLDRGARIDLLNGDLLSRNLNHMNYCAANALIPRIYHLPWFRQCAHMYLTWIIGKQTRDCFSYSNQKFLETYPDVRRLLFDSLYAHSRTEMAELFSRVCHCSILCCVKWFMEYDYDINYDYPFWGRSTPLLGLLGYAECDMKDQLRMIEKLLQKSIDINASNDLGRNALMILANGTRWVKHCGKLSLELASSLVKRGIRVDEQDEQVQQPQPVPGSFSNIIAEYNRAYHSKMSSIVRKVISTKKCPKALAPYNQAIVADRTVYCSGVLGMELDTLKLVPGGAAAQTAKALEHLTNLLSEAGSGIDKVVKTTVLLGDMNDYATVNDEYKKVFSSSFPARTCYGGVKLPLGAAVEIEAIALTGAVL